MLLRRNDPAADVQEWLVDQLAVLDQPYRADLIDDEQPAAAVAGVCQVDWRHQAGGDGLQFDGIWPAEIGGTFGAGQWATNQPDDQ